MGFFLVLSIVFQCRWEVAEVWFALALAEEASSRTENPSFQLSGCFVSQEFVIVIARSEAAPPALLYPASPTQRRSF